MSDPRQRVGPAIAGLVWMLAAAALTACASKPLVEYTTDVPPLLLTTIGQAGIEDEIHPHVAALGFGVYLLFGTAALARFGGVEVVEKMEQR